MRWLIVEDALRDRKGHWFEYLGTFARELRALGDDVTILADSAAEPFLIEQLKVKPVLPASIWHRMGDSAGALRRYLRVPSHAWKTFRALKNYLSSGEKFDVIFVPTVLVHHLLGWTWLIKRVLKNSPSRIVLFFPNTPISSDPVTNVATWHTAPTAKLFNWLIRSLASEVKQGRVILGAETHPMRTALTQLTGVPFTYFPHPVALAPEPASEKTGTNENEIVMGSYGSARHEKGSDVLVAAVDEYVRRYPATRARFVLQSVDGDPKLWARLKDNDKIRIIPNYFAGGEYTRQLRATDVLLLPYRHSSYGLRVSRVVIEAMVQGLPVVTTRGTTPESQAREFGAAVFCTDGDVESLVRAIHETEQRFVELKNRATEMRLVACDHFSVKNFRALLSADTANTSRLTTGKISSTSAPNVKPKVLIVSLEIWPAIARLPKALQQAGFEVGALCYPDSYLATTRYLDRFFECHSKRRGGSILRQLTEIIQDWRPQFIVPGDDRTVLFFQALIQSHHEGKYSLTPDVLEILRASFGNFGWLAEATSKRLTLEHAKKLGLKIPKCVEVSSVAEAVEQAQKLGWPVALKKSTAWGGGGVAFCENVQQVAAVYTKYSEATRWLGRMKSLVFQARGWTLGRNWFPADLSVTVNEVIPGKPAMMAVAAANGKILAHVIAIAEKCHPEPSGPSTVVRFISHPDIHEAVEKLVSQWGATGLLGFDFMLNAAGEASLLECNPRPICLSYMGALSGSDLCLALQNHFTGQKIPTPTAPRHEIVAHFPQEWRRDPNSPYLLAGYHDVPSEDPGLFNKLVKDFRPAN